MTRLAPALLLAAAGLAAWATDPPHTIAVANTYGSLNYCTACHKLHGATGGALTTVAGNANLCLSCHMSGGTASAKALGTADQAVPAGLLGSTAGGTSHRWDSGAQGRLIKGTPNTSTGTITPSGAYAGAYATTVQIRITTAGATGTAKYDWSMTTPGTTTLGTATTGVSTSTIPAPLGTTGVSLAFSSTGTFNLNDVFYLYLRHDLRSPATSALASRLENGKVMCSTCHDQHLQANTPFDPAASQTYTAGTTNDRHFQRINNHDGSLCGDCHAARSVGRGGTSHPVNLPVAGAANTRTPTSVPLTTAGNVHCLSCHEVHHAPATTSPAGMLLRVSHTSALCTDCHTLADSTTASTHTNPVSGILWPGDAYGGSTYPAIADTALRGACRNCHTPHGWPDAGTPGSKYASALGARQEYLCETCHDASGPSTRDVRTPITRTGSRHPVERTSGTRLVSCADCHNPHMAIPGVHAYATTATVNRNRIRDAAGTTVYIGALKGADGVAFSYGALSNWATPAASWFTRIIGGSPATPASGAEFEYQVCFKCHTSYDPEASTPTNTVTRAVAWGGVTNHYSTGTARFTSASTAVTGTGTAWAAGMVGMYIQKNPSSPAYRIAAIVSATSLTLASPYGGPTDAAAAAYTITRDETDQAQEFNPKNASYHPVVAGLSGGGSTALTTGRTLAPWTALGTQTMLCSDCHNVDAASPAAQGPHGSASQFMLRTFTGGAPAANWPNVTLANARSTTVASQSWCNNCHPIRTSTNSVHTRSDHASAPCYSCHIVVPHGGKLNRLMGTNTPGMPTRYAYQGLRSNNWLRAYVKSTSYSKSSCGSAQSGCTTHSLATSTTNSW